MATTADIKIGACIELEGKTFQIVDFQHVKPGKGPAFVRTKLKNLENGRKAYGNKKHKPPPRHSPSSGWTDGHDTNRKKTLNPNTDNKKIRYENV